MYKKINVSTVEVERYLNGHSNRSKNRIAKNPIKKILYNLFLMAQKMHFRVVKNVMVNG